MVNAVQAALIILRRKQVEAATGLSCSTIYRRIKDKTFPLPVKLGANSVGWRAGDIEAFLAAPSEYRAGARAMTKKKKAAAPIRNGSAAQKNERFNRDFTGNSAAAQRARLLAALREGPISTLEARRQLDVLMPAARVHELRHQAGHNITMSWVMQPTDAGRLHRVAMYSMIPGKWRQS